MIKDYFKFSWNSIRNRQVRAWLTIIGILIGITSIVALVSLGQGLQESVNKQFEKIGINRVTISAGGLALGPMGGEFSTAILTEEDVDVIDEVRGVESVTFNLMKTKKVEFGNEVKHVSVVGVPTDAESLKIIKELSLFDIETGRELRSSDQHNAILGKTISEEEFKRELTTRDRIDIGGIKFNIIGVQEKAGTGVHDNMIRIPLDTARNLFEEEEEVSMITTTTQKEVEPSEVAERIKKALRKHRDVKKGEEDFKVATAEQTIESLTGILGVIQIFLVGIAAISLFVGGVGIMNTMYTSVMERTNEIGLMKAIGARDSDVLFIFLIESGILGVIGGIFGVGLGIGLAKVGELIAVQLGVDIFQAYISIELVVGALLFSFLIGAISGLLPAKQAAQLEPVEALRKK